jgi:hypothetical protein
MRFALSFATCAIAWGLHAPSFAQQISAEALRSALTGNSLVGKASNADDVFVFLSADG